MVREEEGRGREGGEEWVGREVGRGGVGVEG